MKNMEEMIDKFLNSRAFVVFVCAFFSAQIVAVFCLTKKQFAIVAGVTALIMATGRLIYKKQTGIFRRKTYVILCLAIAAYCFFVEYCK